MNEITEIDDYRPHVVIQGKQTVHVIPRSCLQAVIDGDMVFTDIEDWEDIIGPIIADILMELPPPPEPKP